MNPSRKPATGLLLFALVVFVFGCSRKPAERTEPEPTADPKPKVERPAPDKPTPPIIPPTNKPPDNGQSRPKTADAKPLEVQFSGTDFDDVKVGDGVSFRATCVGKEDDRLILTDALRHTGTRPAMTAPELHAAYTKDATAADKRFQHKGLTVRGVVVDKVDKARGRLLISPTEEPKAIKPDGKPDLTKNKPDHTLTAREFRTEFVSAPGTVNMTARAKFEGKTVEVTGVISRFRSERGRASIVLVAGDTHFEVTPMVPCYTLDDEPWGKVIPGQTVTLRGVAPKALSSPFLVDCVIVGSEPAEVRTFAAPDIAAEYKASRAAANKKFGGQIYVTGEVASTEVDGGGGVHLTLKTGPGLPKVVFVFPWGDEDYRASCLPPGTKVKVYCMYSENYDPAEVKLAWPLFVFE